MARDWLREIFTIGWIALAATSMPTFARAATFDVDLDREPCGIRLTGPIEQGDFQRLKAKLPADYAPPKAGPTICLNSRGGDFVEALQIAEFVSQGLSTQLESGAVCFSACGWIFLAGTITATQASREWNRTMDAHAALAFHAPTIDPATLSSTQAAAQPLTLAEAIGAYNQAVAEIAQGLLKLAQKYDFPATSPLVPPTLLAEALVKVGKDLLVVDTIGAVVKWRIAVSGYASVVPHSKDDIVRACLLASAQANEWTPELFANLATVGHEDYVGYYDAAEHRLTAQVVIYRRGSVGCELQFTFNDALTHVEGPITGTVNLDADASILRVATLGDRTPLPLLVPDFAILPPDTRLANLPARDGRPVDLKTLVTVAAPNWCRSQQVKRPEEKAVCDSPKLSAMDGALNRLYGEALAGDSKREAQADQRGWLPKRQLCGGDLDCLERNYRAQISKMRGYINQGTP